MSLINFLTRVHFADRVLEDGLPVELARLGLRRVLLVSDGAGQAEAPRARLLALLAGECDWHELQVTARCGAETVLMPEDPLDGVIGFGGPAALCTGLTLSLGRRRGQSRLPMIAIPTTSAAVGFFPQGEGEASGALSAAVPSVILCDPTLTLWADAEATVDAGIEALSGCIESYLSSAWNPPADGIALDGIARIADHLSRAAANGGDLEARRHLLAGGLGAGLAGQKGRGAAAAMVRALQREASCAAGALHAALLPEVLRFNAPALGKRTEPLAHVLRLGAGTAVVEGLESFLARHGRGEGLGKLGFTMGQIDHLARVAAEDPATGSNPRLAGEAEYRALLLAAF